MERYFCQFKFQFEMSEQRLFSLYRKLKEHPKLLHQYNEVFEQQLADGVIEKVDVSHYDNENTHFCVILVLLETIEKTIN